MDFNVFNLTSVKFSKLEINFFVFSSGGSRATVIIKQSAIDIQINGKPSMFVTSYGTTPNHESLRRYPIINLDPSEDQTIAISAHVTYFKEYFLKLSLT